MNKGFVFLALEWLFVSGATIVATITLLQKSKLGENLVRRRVIGAFLFAMTCVVVASLALHVPPALAFWAQPAGAFAFCLFARYSSRRSLRTLAETASLALIWLSLCTQLDYIRR